jgi:catechol 2,3-dioxygenase-like lactoylglutathione lyase family enzyme
MIAVRRHLKETHMSTSDEPFEVRGINHFALVCSDMDQTVDFYSRVLGFPLTKTLELPNGVGKHFFFDIGVAAHSGGPQLGFFWFTDGPGPAPGVASPSGFPDPEATFATAAGSLNHLAFDVPVEKLDEYRERLKANGVKCTRIVRHDDSPEQFSGQPHAGVHTVSIYFFDPDGILLELAAWTRELDDDDVELAAAEQMPTVASEILHAGDERTGDAAPFL